MFRKSIIIPFFAAAGVALAACNPKPADKGIGEDNSAMAANEIMAATNGVEGVPTGGACGGVAGLKCSSDKDFCKTAQDRCGTMDVDGKCTTRPEICTKEYNPVCGCDGKTYGNACEADAAGVNVDKTGACKPKG